jgi:anti-sigma factor RsiW
MRVRRLQAGELAGPEKERTEAHVAGCARCAQVVRELEQEREALRRDMPFPAFAAGVAEKLAQAPQRPPDARRWALSGKMAAGLSRWAPFAAAAGILLVSGLVLRPGEETPGVRSKGGASARMFVQDARGVRELAAEPVASGASLRLVLHSVERKHMTVVLLEPGETSVLYAGPATASPPAFEWTGTGSATVLVVLDDTPVSGIKSERDIPKGAEVLRIPLHR